MIRDVRRFQGNFHLVIERSFDKVLKSWPYRARITVKSGYDLELIVKISNKQNAIMGKTNFNVSDLSIRHSQIRETSQLFELLVLSKIRISRFTNLETRRETLVNNGLNDTAFSVQADS